MESESIPEAESKQRVESIKSGVQLESSTKSKFEKSSSEKSNSKSSSKSKHKSVSRAKSKKSNAESNAKFKSKFNSIEQTKQSAELLQQQQIKQYANNWPKEWESRKSSKEKCKSESKFKESIQKQKLESEQFESEKKILLFESEKEFIQSRGKIQSIPKELSYDNNDINFYCNNKFNFNINNFCKYNVDKKIKVNINKINIDESQINDKVCSIMKFDDAKSNEVCKYNKQNMCNVYKNLNQFKVRKNENLKIFIWNSRRSNEIKKQYIYRTINYYQPEIIFIIDNVYNNLNNLQYYSTYYDGRNFLLIRNEIKHNVYNIKQNIFIVPLINMCFVYITPNIENQEEWISLLDKYLGLNYFIIGDMNLKSNKKICSYIYNNNLFIVGEDTMQTVIIHKDKGFAQKSILIKNLAPSDHKSLLFKVKLNFTATSFYKLTRMCNISDYNQIKNILEGKKLEIQINYRIKKSNLKINDNYLVIRSIINYFIKNNPSFLYKYFSNCWSKFKKEPILGNNIPQSVEISIKKHLLHDERKGFILIDNELMMKTFRDDAMEKIKSVSIDKKYLIRKKNMLGIKSTFSKALNEDLFGLSTISSKTKTYIYNLVMNNKYNEVQNILNNIIQAYNKFIRLENAKVFYLIKNRKLEDFSDVRMITIIPTYFYIFEILYFKEISTAFDRIINFQGFSKESPIVYQFGALSYGGTMLAMNFLKNKIELFNKDKDKNVKGLFIGDIQFGYDSINWDILDEFLDKEELLEEREKKLIKIWTIFNKNMNIWIAGSICKRKIGIPMGCALSPAIFVYYVHKCLDEFQFKSNIIMYIDDVTLILNHNNPKIIIQSFIDNIYNKGKLQLKLKKSKIITDTSYFKDIEFDDPEKRGQKVKFPVEKKFTFLGRDFIYSESNIKQNDEAIVMMDKTRIKKFPLWLSLPEKRMLFNGALAAKQRFIGYMQSIDNKEVRKSHIQEAWKFFRNNFDNTSYYMVVCLIVNFVRLFFDSFDYLTLCREYFESGIKVMNNIFYDDEKNDRDVVIMQDIMNIYTDGSYKNNKIGYGIVLVNKNNVIYNLYGSVDNKFRIYNNVMGEIFAITKAIKICKKNKVKEVNIFYDYIGLEKWIDGKWQTKNDMTKAYKRYIEESGILIHWFKVKAHKNNTYNMMADKLAKKACEDNKEKSNGNDKEKLEDDTSKVKKRDDILINGFYKKILTNIEKIDQLILKTEIPIEEIREDVNVKNSFRYNKKFLNQFLIRMKLVIVDENLSKVEDYLNNLTLNNKLKWIKIYKDFFMQSKLLNKHAWLLEMTVFNFTWLELSQTDKWAKIAKTRMLLLDIIEQWIRYCYNIANNLSTSILFNINLYKWLVSKYEMFDEEEKERIIKEANKNKIFKIEKRYIYMKEKDEILNKMRGIWYNLNVLQKKAYATKRKRIMSEEQESKMEILKKMWFEIRKLIYNMDKLWYNSKFQSNAEIINELIILIRENKETINLLEECELDEEDQLVKDEDFYNCLDEVKYDLFEQDYI